MYIVCNQKRTIMKKLLFLLLPATMILSCSDNKSTTETTTGDTTTNSKMDDRDDADDDNVSLAYSTPHPADWIPAPKSNVAVAMNALRSYEMNDMNALAQTLGDSVEFYGDNFAFKGTRDSLMKAISSMRSSYDSVSIRMHDYESVKSKSRGDQWVSLWYTESSRKGGKTDSVMVMDDVKIKDGKVVLIDTKARRLVAKKM